MLRDLGRMKATNLKFGIPNLELGCASGTTINPSSFAGHDFIALFCPIGAGAATQEIETYRRHYADFVKLDAWLLTFADRCDALTVDGTVRMLTIPDPQRNAWVAFRDLTRYPEELDRSSGATFLFSRGGGLHRYWHGAGHVDDVLAELRKPSFDHVRQAGG